MSATLPDIDIATVNQELEAVGTIEILKWCYKTFAAERIKLSTSFGAEGMVLLHMLVDLVKTPCVFFIDTGRNFQETYDVWQRVVERYGVKIESYAPDPADLAQLQSEGGPNVFYQSAALRRQCCFVRKVKPLKRALADCDLWLAPLRRGQSDGRANTPILAYVEEHNLYKVCPLAKWSEQDVWEYIRNNAVPYNALYDQGYLTIGCAPCTRPVRPAEGQRASRWWWETDERKECGLHLEDDKRTRKKGPPSWTI